MLNKFKLATLLKARKITTKGVRRFALLVFVLCISFLSAVPEYGAATGSRQKQYAQDFETVWAATVGVLQAHGDPIIYNDKTSGVITTDYKIEDEEDWRHKFNLLLTRSADGTNLSVSCTVENRRQNHSFWARGGLTWEDEKSDGKREAALLDVIAKRLQPGGVAADNSNSNCRANFSVRGSIVRGTSYETHDEFSALTPASAFDALLSSLRRESYAVQSSDKNTGVVSATGQAATGKSFSFDFSVASSTSGAQVSVVEKLRPGVHGTDDAVRDEMCKIISGMAQLTSKSMPPKATAATSSPSPASIEERLRKLDELYKKGLITEEEYKKKRAELLSGL